MEPMLTLLSIVAARVTATPISPAVGDGSPAPMVPGWPSSRGVTGSKAWSGAPSAAPGSCRSAPSRSPKRRGASRPTAWSWRSKAGGCTSAFSRASLPHLFVKGQTLGMLAWGDPLVKQQLDIDLLVPPTAIGKAARLLDTLGYVQQVPEPSVDTADWHRSHKESQWRSDDGILLDLHSRLGDHPALVPSAIATVAPRMVEVPGGFALPTLPDRLLLPYLAVHGASSAWFRLKWLADFAALVARTPADALATLIDQAPRLGAGRDFGCRADPRQSHCSERRCPRGWRRTGRRCAWCGMATDALDDPDEPTAKRFGTLPLHRSQLLLIPGSHYFLSELVRKLGLLLIR